MIKLFGSSAIVSRELPIDFKYEFTQTAKTNGWLAGDSTYKSAEDFVGDEESTEESTEDSTEEELVPNDSIWVAATVSERSSLIRSMGIKDMQAEGYAKTSGLTDVQLYSETQNEFVMIASMNPLYSAEDEPTLSVADVDKATVIEAIERLCGKMKSTTDGKTIVKTKIESNGTTTKKDNNCANAYNKIVLVIPEDEGLKALIEAAISEAETNGVTFEVIASYGKGANKVPGMSGGE